MNSERIITINGNKIEEFYWHGKYVVYKNNKLSCNNYDEEVKNEQEKESKTQQDAPVRRGDNLGEGEV